MACASCNKSYTRPSPCNTCGKQTDTCDDAIQLAYVPGTACTIGITYNCVTSTLSLREGIQNCETDTRMVWNADTGCINYYSERYTNNMETGVPNIICASEIASAINLCDLNDVSDNACDPDQCALLVYQKTANCGANCKGVNDMWVPWTVADHKSDYLTYVMGFNDEGCPIVLDVPSDKSKYWWAMWRGDSKFGYTQPNKVDSLPTDDNGDPLVISQNADGSPIVAPLKVNTDDIVYHTVARTTLATEKPYYGQSDFEIRIDSREGNDGSMEAPDDMLVSVDWCSDYTGTTAENRTFTVTVAENTTNIDEDYVRDYARHFQNGEADWAMPGHLTLVVHKGNHLKFHAESYENSLGQFRMHQVNVVWTKLHAYREYRK